MKRFASTLLLALIGLSLWAITAQEAVDAYAARKGMRHASAGVVVIDIDSNKVIAGNLQDQAMVTASTMKTVTSITALETLGGDYRFKTKVYLQGKVVGDTLMGSEKYQYVLPFEFISLFLLACIIGGIVISRKDK